MENININYEKYKIALSEVDDILFFTDDSIKSKIPNSFLNFVKENKDTTYISNINPYLDINEQNISEEAKAIMALIYRSYIATEEEKREYQKKDKNELEQKEEEKKEKYNPDNIFKQEKIVQENLTDENLDVLVVNEKSGVFERIKNFFQKIFNKKKKI